MGDQAIDIRTPASRATDPETSHQAELQFTESGERSKQQSEVYQMVRRNQGCTSKEIAQREGVDRYMVAKRLPELEKAGYVFRGQARPCQAAGSKRKAAPWYTR